MTKRPVESVLTTRLAFGLSFLGLLACGGTAAHPRPLPATASDGFPGQAWEAGDPSTLDWSPEALSRARRYVESVGSAAVMVVTAGKVVAAWGDTARSFSTHSVRKAFLGSLYGPYVAAGVIDTGATLASLKIGEKLTTLTGEEGRATVADLLRSRSGVYIPAAAEDQAMRDSRPVRGSHPAGTFWYYNNWDMNVAGALFRRLTNEDLFEALKRKIADPIGMQDYRPADGRYDYADYSLYPSYLFRISARDLARFGVLMLHSGRWRGTQVIPESWAKQITRVHSRTGMSGSKSGFGMMWRVTAEDAPELNIRAGMVSASGSGGQRLYVIPDLETVVVNLMNTDVRGGPRLSDAGVDSVLARILDARVAREP